MVERSHLQNRRDNFNLLVRFDSDETTIVLQHNGKSTLSRFLTFSTSGQYTLSFSDLEIVVGFGHLGKEPWFWPCTDLGLEP